MGRLLMRQRVFHLQHHQHARVTALIAAPLAEGHNVLSGYTARCTGMGRMQCIQMRAPRYAHGTRPAEQGDDMGGALASCVCVCNAMCLLSHANQRMTGNTVSYIQAGRCR